jgi:DNA-binding transcriptional regulator YdaS (Cro superfamily)
MFLLTWIIESSILSGIMSRETLKKAVDIAGGQTSLARGIRARLPRSKVGQVHVWGWLNHVKMEVPPAEAVIPIAEITTWQVTPHELRPDLYPNPTDAMPGFA